MLRKIQAPSLTGLESVALVALPSDSGVGPEPLLEALRQALAPAELEVPSARRGVLAEGSHLRLGHDLTMHAVHGRPVFVTAVTLELIQEVCWSWTADTLVTGGLAATWSASRTAVHPTHAAAVAGLARQVESLGNQFAGDVREANKPHVTMAFVAGPGGDARCVAETTPRAKGRTPKPPCGEEH